MKNKLRLLLASIIITTLVMIGCNIRPDDLFDDSDLIPAILAGGRVYDYFPGSTVRNEHRATVVNLGNRWWYVSADMSWEGEQVGSSGIFGGTIRYQMVIAKDSMPFFANPANEETLQVTVRILGRGDPQPQRIGGMCFWEYFNDRLESTKAGIISQGIGASSLSPSLFMNEVAPQTNRSLAGAAGNHDGQRNREILDKFGISLNLMIPIRLVGRAHTTYISNHTDVWRGWEYGEMPSWGWGQNWQEHR